MIEFVTIASILRNLACLIEVATAVLNSHNEGALEVKVKQE